MSIIPSAPRKPLRNPTRLGRSYPAEVVAGVRGLFEGAGLSYREAAARFGLNQNTVGRWARRFGWRRAPVAAGAQLSSPLEVGCCRRPLFDLRTSATADLRWGGPSRTPDLVRGKDRGGGPSAHPEGDELAEPPLPGSRPARGRPAYARGRRNGYGPEVREAARGLVEGTSLGLERIGLELGIASWTIHRWRKLYGWQRPAKPAKRGPDFYRSRRPGRPYGADAVGTARDLLARSTLPTHRIAAQAGIHRATLYRWMKRPGWTRHPAKPGRPHHPPYGPEIMAAARELYLTTMLPTAFIAARVKATTERVRHWARSGGWTRPRHLPEADGRVRRRRG